MEQLPHKAFLNRASCLILLIALAWAVQARAQCVDSSKVFGFKVRSIKVQALLGRIPDSLQQQLNRHTGEAYSADQANVYSQEILKFINEDPIQQKFQKLIADKLKFSIKAAYYELGCAHPVDPAECQKSFANDPSGPVTQCVDVTIKGRNLELDALNSSPYLLLLPRSALVALFGAIPRPLLALNPSFGGEQDRKFGPSLGVDTSTDLLDLGRIAGEGKSAQSEAAPKPEDQDSDTKLLLSMKGRKSLSKEFYDTSQSLTFERSEALERFQRLALEAKFDSFNVPHGEGRFLRNGVSLGFSTDVRLKSSPFRLLNFTGKYRWSRNRFFSDTGSLPLEVASENAFESRFIADGNIKQGLTRVAAWFDGGALNSGRGNYQRAAIEAGYGKEFVIPHKKEFRKIIVSGQECLTSYGEDPTKNEQTVGVELLAGAGRVWGNAPEYARFYGGNLSGNLLYDDFSAQSLTAFPSGPLLRSVKQKQAGAPVALTAARGGTSYLHANLNVSIPIAAWSRPLIPTDWVTVSAVNEKTLKADQKEFNGQVNLGDMICRDLKFTLKNTVRESGQNLLIATQARALLTDAQRKAMSLNPNGALTATQRAALDEAQAAYQANKVKLRPEIEELFAEEILPITDFIADHANFYSVKPLVMFDMARLSLDNAVDNHMRYAIGGGLQLDVVLARFEVGYLTTLNRAVGDDRGNFVVRLVFKRLF